jgi:hypothetical protein
MKSVKVEVKSRSTDNRRKIVVSISCEDPITPQRYFRTLTGLAAEIAHSYRLTAEEMSGEAEKETMERL